MLKGKGDNDLLNDSNNKETFKEIINQQEEENLKFN
jgi:hypothetical protein